MSTYNQALARRYNSAGLAASGAGDQKRAVQFFTNALALWPEAEYFSNRALATLAGSLQRRAWRMAADDFLVAAVIAFDDYWGQVDDDQAARSIRRDYVEYLRGLLQGASYASLLLNMPELDAETAGFFRLSILAMLGFDDYEQRFHIAELENPRLRAFVKTLSDNEFDDQVAQNTARLLTNYQRIFSDPAMRQDYLAHTRKENARVLAADQIVKILMMMEELLNQQPKGEHE